VPLRQRRLLNAQKKNGHPKAAVSTNSGKA
jgi:hypothetical protein